jgi:hypothetical protein
MPKLYILAGPNGAGKTTAAYSLLPNVFQTVEFVNADQIARGLSPFKLIPSPFKQEESCWKQWIILLRKKEFCVWNDIVRPCLFKIYTACKNGRI